MGNVPRPLAAVSKEREWENLLSALGSSQLPDESRLGGVTAPPLGGRLASVIGRISGFLAGALALGARSPSRWAPCP